MHQLMLRLAAAVLATATLLPAYGQAPAAPVPAEHFFANPVFSSAKLSPNGRSLAVRFGGPGSRERLAVIDLDKNAIKVVAQFKKMDIGYFQWVNNERLVFDSEDKSVAPGDTAFWPGLYAVNRDGSNYIQLVDARGDMTIEHHVGPKLLPPNTYLVRQPGRQDSDEVYVTSQKLTKSNPPELEHVSLLRLNTLTGRTEGFQRPGPTRQWLLDHQGEPRLATTLDKNTQAIWYRDPAGKEWRKLAAFDGYVGGKGAFTPLAFAPDGTLYVTSNANKDKFALHAYDLKAAALQPKPLIELADFDFSGKLITNKDKLLGIRYLSDAQATVWFDPAMKSVQAKVDAALPDTVNLIDVAARAETPWVLVTSYSDVRPSTMALFNTETGKLNKVGALMENIDPSRMASQELVRYKARDGLDIPAWLTIPKGSKRKDLPMVVLVHGGPYVRGHEWGWDAQVQFLASRGYAVLQPEFRGSMGYGNKHYRAGWKQWGLAMQNDIADGARWAIAQGIVDPKRICIAGASYGGYAALMGLVNDPDLFACGINWAGVTDINLLYTGHWSFTSDTSEGYKQYGMPVLVGDPVADAAQLKATSPLEQAARITKPLMLAYGAADTRVPLYHGRKFHDAVKANNKNVEWVLYNDEGHGWTLPQNRVDFWTRVEKFLEQHIGKP
ncbi:MAG: alpha/beta hydrolase family protein [Telluria sp.]